MTNPSGTLVGSTAKGSVSSASAASLWTELYEVHTLDLARRIAVMILCATVSC